jgi:hypothetical protein
MIVTSDRDVEMLQTFVAPPLKNFPQYQKYWFKQDGATSHTARQSMAAVSEFFSNRASQDSVIFPGPKYHRICPSDVFLMWGLPLESGLHESARDTR